MNKKLLGILSIILGVLLLISALGIAFYNTQAEKTAESSSEKYLEDIIDTIENRKENPSNLTDIVVDDNNSSQNTTSNEIQAPQEEEKENSLNFGAMTVVEIDGHSFVGYLEIPSLGLKLPIISETDMKEMKIAPCRFSGAPQNGNLVIGAHNYRSHFGNIKNLSHGERVIFSDMEGRVYEYTVSSTEILQPYQGDILASGEFPLTLYTCTYGGKTRVAVRCEYAK